MKTCLARWPFVLCLALLAACASAPQRLPQAAGEAPGCTDATLTASEAAMLAVANSPELNAETERLALRSAAWKLGIRAWLPKLTVSYGDDERVALYGPDSHTMTLSARVDQPLWDGGRLAAARALERADMALAASNHQRALRQVGETAITAYRSVLASRARLGIRRASLAASTEERAVIAAEVALGLATANDLADADAQLADMDVDATEAQMALLVSEEQLVEALGLETMPELADTLSLETRYPGFDAQRVADMAADRSPEVAAARHEVEKKKAQLKAASSSWLPTIGLIASGQASGNTLPLTRASWSVGLSVDFSGPLAAGGSAMTVGGQPPFDASAQAQHRLTVLPDPASMLDAKGAAADLALQEQLLSRLVAKARRMARAALVSMELAQRKRDAAANALELAASRARLARLKASVGQAVRTEAVRAELARAERAIDLVDAAAAMVAAERELERLLDIAPGELLADPSLRIGTMEGTP